jgi:hypothetical protein
LSMKLLIPVITFVDRHVNIFCSDVIGANEVMKWKLRDRSQKNAAPALNFV